MSPDGRLLLYFVHQGSRNRTSYTNAWTGVSRLLWLDALGLWPWNSTWGGGGNFEGNRKVVLAAGEGFPASAHPDHPGLGLKVAFGGNYLHASSNEVAGAEWCGRDQRGRLISASHGQLLWHRDNRDIAVLADFNGIKPDPQPAPEWATRPLVDKCGKPVY